MEPGDIDGMGMIPIYRGPGVTEINDSREPETEISIYEALRLESDGNRPRSRHWSSARMDLTLPHERVDEDHTPSTHSLPSNGETAEEPEMQSGNNFQASNAQQSQGSLAFDITKSLICVGDGLIGKTAFLA